MLNFIQTETEMILNTGISLVFTFTKLHDSVHEYHGGNGGKVCKYLHGIYSVDCSDLLPLYESSSFTTQGHSLK